MAKLFRKNKLNQVARRRLVKTLVRATCIFGAVSAPLSVSGQDLLAPPALPSMEAVPALPSCQPSLESGESRCGGVPLALRATRLLGLKKVPQIEWAAIDSQLPRISTQDIELPTIQKDSMHEVCSPTVAKEEDTTTDNPSEATEDSLESLLSVDLPPVEPIETPSEADETDSLISVASMASLEPLPEAASADEDSSDSLLNIEVASETSVQPTQATRAPEIVKHGPSMQLRVGPALPTVRITDVEDTIHKDSVLNQTEVALNTTPQPDQANSKSPELAKPAKPKMVINAVPAENESLASKNIQEKTKAGEEAKEPKLAEEKVRENSESKGGLVEPALPAQFSMTDRDTDPTSNSDSKETQAPLSRALAMSLESVAKTKGLALSEKSTLKDTKTSAVKSQPTIQSVSAQVEMKSEPPTNRTTTPPTLGPQMEVDAGESQSIQLQSPVVNISVEHPDFCQVVKNGEKSLSVIGIKPGKTRIAIFSAQNSVEIREVTVSGLEDQQSARERMAKEMSRAVEKMYRSSSVEVVADEEGLVVQGFAESENEAKKIIRMIRQSSLMPVVDRLSTYK